MIKKQKKPVSIRVEDKVWKELKKLKLKSGKNWDKFLLDLIEEK